jgi:hypothetical protein
MASSRKRSLDGVLEAVAADEAHGVVGAAVAVTAQAVDGDDAGVLQAAGDLGFEEEAGSALGVVGVPVLDLLEGDLAAQLLVAGHEHLAQAPLGVRPQDQEAAGGRGGGVGAGGVGVVAGRGRADVDQAGLHVGVGDLAQVLAQRPDRAEGGQALLRVVAVLRQVALHAGFQPGAVVGVEGPLLDEDLGTWPRGRALSSTQAFMAATGSSRDTKSICRARMPNSRFRSAAG